MRLSLHEESTTLYREANVFFWAKGILKMTYDYINHSIADAAEPPPFQIPRIRFVDAALILAYSDRPNAPQGPGALKHGRVSTVYLAEELIEDPTDNGFFKYIHNGNPVPRKQPNEAANEMAQFLGFTQHVQYDKTGGQVYISDYQG
ncbi:hypothetical protein HYDPIDRAFT_95192 [Hydnomerulius pinastri MD-312]|uniref:Alpha-type protein kinase domain-containing protein n=1 Tax=Hydnomerulius pinastri MD-312 TaxID=994086 RepID=A0A0C9WD18_9AGAM|nr:hypothetical protein HYDPIDRAFT_95192 [Hydnomerulius pinastri MD-312]